MIAGSMPVSPSLSRPAEAAQQVSSYAFPGAAAVSYVGGRPPRTDVATRTEGDRGMPTPMNDQQVLDFLAAGAPTAHLATVRPDGRPHAVPVWFVVDGAELVFVTHSSSVKARNLSRTGYAAVSVDDPRPPFSFATVEGPVALSTDLEEVRHWGEIGAARYLGAEAAAAYAYGEHFPDDLLGRLTPARLTGMADLAT